MCGCRSFRRRLRCIATNVYCRDNLIGRIECGRFIEFEENPCPCSE